MYPNNRNKRQKVDNEFEEYAKCLIFYIFWPEATLRIWEGGTQRIWLLKAEVIGTTYVNHQWGQMRIIIFCDRDLTFFDQISGK